MFRKNQNIIKTYQEKKKYIILLNKLIKLFKFQKFIFAK
jgi:hypothetical protein